MEPVITPSQMGSQKDFWSTLKTKKTPWPYKNLMVSSAKYLQCTFFWSRFRSSSVSGGIQKSWPPAEEAELSWKNFQRLDAT